MQIPILTTDQTFGKQKTKEISLFLSYLQCVLYTCTLIEIIFYFNSTGFSEKQLFKHLGVVFSIDYYIHIYHYETPAYSWNCRSKSCCIFSV